MTPLCRSFYARLVQFTQQKSITSGKSLHAQIIKTGSSSCIFISNNLVNFYAKCLLLHEAHLAFLEIQYKDVVSWNAVINGYSQLGGPAASSLAMELFKRMRAENVLPDAHTFAGFFSAASNLEDPFGAKQAHAVAVRTASCSNVYVGSSLLNAYCKSGLVCEARKVFDRIPHRNSFSFATMISGYAMLRLAKEAMELFRLVTCEGDETVNEFVLTSVLSAFTLPEFIDNGKQVHCVGLKRGLLSVVSVGNAVVTMYAKCGNVCDALHAFELSIDKNDITWSALVTGYAQSGNGKEALKVFSNMHFSGLFPSEFTLVGVFNACSDIGALGEGKQVHVYATKLGFESHEYVMTALIDMYAKCGSLADAHRGFDHLQEPDLVSWTTMIGGYVQNGENEDAMSLYCRMRMEGIVPNEHTMASILKACSNLTALEQGKQIHVHIIKHGFNLEVPVGSALMSMYAKCGSLDDGDLIFRRMSSGDVVCWNSMISGLSQNGRGDEALELFEEMLAKGPNPDSVTLVNVLSACSHMGLVVKGWDYFKKMSDEFGLSPTVEHYACVVDLLGRAGKLNEAKEFIESAAIDHGLCLWRILLVACRNYGNYELGSYAGEKLMELGSPESSAYVLLSSIYTALGKREEVERVRKMMNIRGVSKEPGCSWIELKTGVHVFVVGDQLHPRIEVVRGNLRNLYKLMKDEGYKLASDLFSDGFQDQDLRQLYT